MKTKKLEQLSEGQTLLLDELFMQLSNKEKKEVTKYYTNKSYDMKKYLRRKYDN